MGFLLRFAFRLLLLLVVAYGLAWVTKRRQHRPMAFGGRAILHTPLRPLVHPVRRTLARSHVEAGATVLELGPGTGYFTIDASRMVGTSGRLLSLEIQPPMLAELAERLRAAGVTDSHLLLADATHLPLADDSVDTAYLVAVLGEIPDRPRALAELRRVLRSGGVLSITEVLIDPDYQFEGSLRNLCRASGFEPMEHFRGFLGYTINFTAP